MIKFPANTQPYLNCFAVNVTPELAKEWIKKNNFNRPVKQQLINDYARQILNGNWRRTHQGIAFDEDGIVLNGQHRLLAIIQTGKTIPMLVFTNEKQVDHEFIDSGKKRSHLDVVRLELRDNTIKSKELTVLKALYAGRNCKNQNYLMSPELVALFRRHFDAVRFAVSMLDRSAVDDTTLMAVVARAYYTVSRDKLLEFCNLIHTGKGDHPSRELIGKFRSWLDCLEDRQESTRREIYKRAEAVLKAFIDDEPDCDLFREHKEYFPIYGNTTKED